MRREGRGKELLRSTLEALLPAPALLVRAGLAGEVSATAADVLAKAERLCRGEPDLLLGLDVQAGLEEVLGAIQELTGFYPRPGVERARIDPARALKGALEVALALARAVRQGGRVLFATGHPVGLLPFYQSLASLVREAGGEVLETGKMARLKREGRRFQIRYLGGVAVLTDGTSALHTHEAWPAEPLLDGPHPDLVFADHGFAGLAAGKGLPSAAVVDVNDPALALAWSRGMLEAALPVDDNADPSAYLLFLPLFRAAIFSAV